MTHVAGIYFTGDIAFSIHDPLSNTDLDGVDVLRYPTSHDKRIESPAICEGKEVYQLFNVCIDTGSYEEYGFGEEMQIVATDTRTGKEIYRCYLNPHFVTQMRTIATATTTTSLERHSSTTRDYADDDEMPWMSSGISDDDFEVPWPNNDYDDDDGGGYGDGDEYEFCADVYPMNDGSFHIESYDDGGHASSSSCRRRLRTAITNDGHLGSSEHEQELLREHLRAQSCVSWLRYEMDEPLILDFLQSGSGSVYLRRITYVFPNEPKLSRIVVLDHEVANGTREKCQQSRGACIEANVPCKSDLWALATPVVVSAAAATASMVSNDDDDDDDDDDERGGGVLPWRPSPSVSSCRLQQAAMRGRDSSLPRIVQDFSRLKIK